MLQKFATQIDSETLEQFRLLAATQGRKLQALIGEALTDYLKNQQTQHIRPAVLQQLTHHQTQFGDVYQALIKQSYR